MLHHTTGAQPVGNAIWPQGIDHKKIGISMSTSEDNNTWQVLFDALFEGAVLMKGDRIEAANPVFEGWVGEPSEQLAGQSLQQYLAPTDNNELTFDIESCQIQDVGIRNKDGGMIPSRMQLIGMPSSAPDTSLVLFEDRSTETQFEQELHKHRQLKAIAALSGGIAHDYNNILTAIIGNLSLVLEDLAPSDPQHGLIGQAQEAALIAKDLTRRLITFSKGGDPVKETAPVVPLVEGAVRFALSGSNCVASFDFEDDIRPIDVDQSQIVQALHNIVINAREAMVDGGIVAINVRNLHLTSPGYRLKPGNFIQITVRDEGVGIPTNVIGRIFDPYFSTKEMGEERGTGLGLSIANSIIERHGGRIRVDSTSGNGASVDILIPASSRSVSVPEDDGPVKEGLVDLTGKGRVLVMDDEAMIRDIAGRLLRRLGYTPTFAASGQEAIDTFRKAMVRGTPFDAVILDLTIRGGMGGKTTVMQLKATDPGIKAIVSSGYSEDPVVVDYREHGFDGVVAKPYRLQELGRQLKSLLT